MIILNNQIQKDCLLENHNAYCTAIFSLFYLSLLAKYELILVLCTLELPNHKPLTLVN